jgi:hypothetical protein
MATDSFDPIQYYKDHRRVPGNEPLSPDEQSTLLGMTQDQIDDLIDIDYKAWELHGKVTAKPSRTGLQSADEASAGWVAAGSNAIKRVGASSY